MDREAGLAGGWVGGCEEWLLYGRCGLPCSSRASVAGAPCLVPCVIYNALCHVSYIMPCVMCHVSWHTNPSQFAAKADADELAERVDAVWSARMQGPDPLLVGCQRDEVCVPRASPCMLRARRWRCSAHHHTMHQSPHVLTCACRWNTVWRRLWNHRSKWRASASAISAGLRSG